MKNARISRNKNKGGYFCFYHKSFEVVTMAERLPPYFSLAVLSLFDKGQQTLPRQQDYASPSSFCHFKCRSVGWTNINKPYAAHKFLELVFYVWHQATSPSVSFTHSLPVKPWATFIFIGVSWIITNELTRTGAPKGQFQENTGRVYSQNCVVCLPVFGPPTVFSCSSSDSRPWFSSRQSIDSLSGQSKPTFMLKSVNDTIHGPGPVALISSSRFDMPPSLERSPPARSRVWHNLAPGRFSGVPGWEQMMWASTHR